MDRKPGYYPAFWMTVYILFLIFGAVVAAHDADCDRTYREIVTDMDAYVWELQCNNGEGAQ